METGKELLLIAAKKEYKLLSRRADKAKAECDEACNVHSELIEINSKLREVMNSSQQGKQLLSQIEALDKRRRRASQVLKMDVLKLIDAQAHAEIRRDMLGEQIRYLEFHTAMQRRSSQEKQ